MKRSCPKFFLCVIALFGWVGKAQAFTMIADIKGWNTKELSFHLNPDNCPAGIEHLINDALATWNSVPTAGLTVKLGDNTNATIEDLQAQASPDVPAIICSTDLVGDANLDPNVIPGLAQGAAADGNGHLNQGYLVLNVQPDALDNISNLDEDVIKVVIAHEIGHVLGLGHSMDKKALMYYNGSAKKHLALAQDDVDGLNYLYARNELGGDAMLGGCATVGKTTSADPPRWWLWAILSSPFWLVGIRAYPKTWRSRREEGKNRSLRLVNEDFFPTSNAEIEVLG